MENYKTYAQKLKDPRWQKKRLEILERDNWTCQICGDTEETLNVHHRKYLPKTEPWEVDSKFLVTLCESCHGVEKEMMVKSLGLLSEILKEIFFSEDVWTIMEGFLNIKPQDSPDETAMMIKWAISNEVMMKKINIAYQKHIKARRAKLKAMRDK